MALSFFNHLHVGFTGPPSCAGTGSNRSSRRNQPPAHLAEAVAPFRVFGIFSTGMQAHRRSPASGPSQLTGVFPGEWWHPVGQVLEEAFLTYRRIVSGRPDKGGGIALLSLGAPEPYRQILRSTVPLDTHWYQIC